MKPPAGEVVAVNLAEFIIRIESFKANVNIPLVRRAYEFAERAHAGQKRESGAPYMEHLTEVALILAEWHMDSATIGAGLMHDVVEDTSVSIGDVARAFGAEIAHLIDGVTKLSHLQYKSREEQQVEYFRKMLLSMARDIRIVLIKLADRVHNMRTLGHVPREKQLRIAQETRDIYAPLAHRFGIQKAKIILEDLSFKYLEPESYQELARLLDQTRDDRELYIAEVVDPIREALAGESIHAEVYGRAKHLDSINRKIKVRGVPFDKIYDLAAIRVIVRSVHECYHVLGLVHSIWKPTPDRFHDYIATPKPNGYQSLHTCVVGPRGKMVEIQIRTREMHHVGENGVASHWIYKEGRKTFDRSDRQMIWLRDALEWQKDMTHAAEFAQYLKVDVFADDIYCVTPQGRIIHLPSGSTPLDFAFAVHTDIGLHCSGARVNGRIAPLSTKLKSGDIVELATSSTRKPSRDWLKIVVSNKAQTKIKRWFNQVEHESMVTLGREMLNRELTKLRLSAPTENALEDIAQGLSYVSGENLLASIGRGDASAKSIVSRLYPEPLEGESKESPISKLMDRAGKAQGIRVQGYDDMMFRYAKCCQPVPGDEIVGYVTRGRGVTIHRADCGSAHAGSFDTERQVEVSWDVAKGQTFPVDIEIIVVDRKNILRDITEVISDSEAYLRGAEIRARETTGVGRFAVDVTNAAHLDRLFQKVRRIAGVVSVRRVRTDGGQ